MGIALSKLLESELDDEHRKIVEILKDIPNPENLIVTIPNDFAKNLSADNLIDLKETLIKAPDFQITSLLETNKKTRGSKFTPAKKKRKK